MEEKIKLCQKLRTSICSANNWSPKTIDDLIAVVRKDTHANIRKEYKPSPFVKMIITSLLTLCDNIYLTRIVISPSKKMNEYRWYDITNSYHKKSATHYTIMKYFLLDVYYHDRDSKSRMIKSRPDIHTVLTFIHESTKQKYAVMLYEPKDPTPQDRECIVEGMCKAFRNILPNNNVYTKIATGKILLENLITIL